MLKKLIGLGLVFGVATTVSALTGGCSSTTTNVTDEGGTNPGKDSGPGVDSGGLPGDDGGGSNCPAAVTSMDIAEVNPPKDNTQGSCTDAELAKITGKFADIVAGISATCAGCLFTEANDMTNTQFFVWADTMHVNVSLQNIGACMGSPYSGGTAACGKAAEEVESCLETACPQDPSTGDTLCTDITATDCVTAALAGDCKQYDDKQTTDCGGATALKAIEQKCFDSKGSIDPGIKLLCGGGSADAAGGG